MAKSKQPEDPRGSRPAWHTELTVGRCYFVQSVTKDWVGRLVSINGPYTVTLEDAVWVADTGTRLHQFLRGETNEQTEVEPVGVVCVQWVNWSPWDHEPFTEAL